MLSRETLRRVGILLTCKDRFGALTCPKWPQHPRTEWPWLDRLTGGTLAKIMASDFPRRRAGGTDTPFREPRTTRSRTCHQQTRRNARRFLTAWIAITAAAAGASGRHRRRTRSKARSPTTASRRALWRPGARHGRRRCAGRQSRARLLRQREPHEDVRRVFRAHVFGQRARPGHPQTGTPNQRSLGSRPIRMSTPRTRWVAAPRRHTSTTTLFRPSPSRRRSTSTAFRLPNLCGPGPARPDAGLLLPAQVTTQPQTL
jgi:hypothetical protein